MRLGLSSWPRIWDPLALASQVLLCITKPSFYILVSGTCLTFHFVVAVLVVCVSVLWRSQDTLWECSASSRDGPEGSDHVRLSGHCHLQCCPSSVVQAILKITSPGSQTIKV